jgi:uncharacterized membrane protein
VELYDWLLFFHVLSAVVVVAALTVLWALVLATKPQAAMIGGDAPMRLGAVAGPLVGVGMTGTLIFGIWLALNVDRYEVWDGWILGALVLWAVGGWAGGRSGKLFQEDPVGNREAAIRFQAINSAAIILILILMIWKPGA